jgi:PAS domain S-box-containing protein
VSETVREPNQRYEIKWLRERLRELESSVPHQPATFHEAPGDARCAERSARQPREQLELVVESAGLAWWDHDFTTQRVQRSENWATMLGYSPVEVDDLADSWKSLIHPDDLPKVEETARLHERGCLPVFEVEHRLRTKDGGWRWILNWGRIVARDSDGRPLRALGTHMDITRRKAAEQHREELIQTLKKALANGGELRDIIPICSSCKKIRDTEGQWNQVEKYLHDHSGAEFTHGICPECLATLFPSVSRPS